MESISSDCEVVVQESKSSDSNEDGGLPAFYYELPGIYSKEINLIIGPQLNSITRLSRLASQRLVMIMWTLILIRYGGVCSGREALMSPTHCATSSIICQISSELKLVRLI